MNYKQNSGFKDIFSTRQIFGRVTKVKNRTHNTSRLKALVGVSFAMIDTLSVTVFQLNGRSKMQAAENDRLAAQVQALQEKLSDGETKLDLISAHNDSTGNKALTYIEGIQDKLGRINSYLRKRGLNSIAFKAGESRTKDKEAHLGLYKKFDRYLDKLVDNIAGMPMGYPRISSFTSFFGHRNNPFGSEGGEFHPGIDFKGRTGDPVKCTASGRVVYSGRAGGYGNCVRIRHINGIETWYGHLSRILVHEGQSVTVGQMIGKVGSTGRSTGPHLHYEVRRNGRAVNPKQYLSLN